MADLFPNTSTKTLLADLRGCRASEHFLAIDGHDEAPVLEFYAIPANKGVPYSGNYYDLQLARSRERIRRLKETLAERENVLSKPERKRLRQEAARKNRGQRKGRR